MLHRTCKPRAGVGYFRVMQAVVEKERDREEMRHLAQEERWGEDGDVHRALCAQCCRVLCEVCPAPCLPVAGVNTSRRMRHNTTSVWAEWKCRDRGRHLEWPGNGDCFRASCSSCPPGARLACPSPPTPASARPRKAPPPALPKPSHTPCGPRSAC